MKKIVVFCLSLVLVGCVTTGATPNLKYALSDSGVSIRVYNADDYADVYLITNGMNQRKILHAPLQLDSGWKDITILLKDGVNHIRFEAYNGQYGGWSLGYIVRIDGQRVIEENIKGTYPSNAVAFSRVYEIVKDKGKYFINKDTIKLHQDNLQMGDE